MPKVIGTGAITMVDTHDIAAISTQVVASAALQQLYDGVAYTPDRSASPLGLTVKVYKAASGSPILIPPESLTNIRWGSSAGASDLNSGVSGVTAVLNQLTISTNSFVSAYEGGRTVYFSAEYVDPYAGVTQAINTSITLLLSVKGADGAVGGSVDVTSNRSLVFAYRDGISETPTDIVLTAVTSNIPGATFKWLLDGVEQAEVGHTFIMSLERFGVLSKSRQVTAVVQGGTNLYQSSVTILRTDTYSVEAGATKGATLGQDFVDDNGTVLSDLALLNKYSNGTQLAGDFTGNPFLVRVDGTYDRPANVKAVWGDAAVGSIAFASTARDSLLLTGGASAKSAGWPAFRTQYGMKYRIVLRWRLLNYNSGMPGVSFVTLCKDSEIASGCTHLGISPAESGVDLASTYANSSLTKVIADTSGVAAGSSIFNKAYTGASPSAWFSTTLEFTPTSTVLWAAFAARVNGAIGESAQLEIDTCYIYSITGTIYADQIAPGIISQLALADAAVTAAKTAIAAIDPATGNLAAGTVTARHIAAGAITANEIAADAITSAKIVAGAIGATELATGAVTSDKIVAGAITADKLTIGTTKFDNVRIKSYGNNMTDKTSGAWLNNVSQGSGGRGTTLWVFNKTTHALVSVTTYDTFSAVANCDALATALAALTSTSVVFITTADACSFNSTSDNLRVQLKRCGASILVDGFTVTGTQYAYALIGYPTLGEGNGLELGKGTGASETPCELSTLWMDDTLVGLSGSVSPLAPLSSTYIKDGSILTAKIAAGAVTASQIAANTITATQIAANTVTATQIAANTITGSKIAADTITAANIAAGTITATEIAAGAITGTKIAAGQTISAPDISGGTLNLGSGKFVVDANGNLTASGSGTIEGNFIIGGKLSSNTLLYAAANSINSRANTSSYSPPANLAAAETRVYSGIGGTNKLVADAMYTLSDLRMAFYSNNLNAYCSAGPTYFVAYLEWDGVPIKAWWVTRAAVAAATNQWQRVVPPAGETPLIPPEGWLTARPGANSLLQAPSTLAASNIRLVIGGTAALPTPADRTTFDPYALNNGGVTLPSFSVALTSAATSTVTKTAGMSYWEVHANISFTLTRVDGNKSVPNKSILFG